MKFEIRSRWSGSVLFALETDSLKLCVEAAVKGGAVLSGADLSGADLSGADLSGANLRSADLRSADLSGADLSGANLRSADLRSADLRSADLTNTILPPFLIVPETGAFDAFKKISTGVLKIRIPAKAQRVNAIGSRKCRASFVKVLEGPEGVSPTHYTKLTYRVGETVIADSFNPDIREECTNGIHFFITHKEAEEWE